MATTFTTTRPTLMTTTRAKATTTTTTILRPMMMMCHQPRRQREPTTTGMMRKAALSDDVQTDDDDAKRNATTTTTPEQQQQQLFFATVGLGASTPSNNTVATHQKLQATSEIENLGKRGRIATGQPFLDHMIDQLTTHAQLGVSVQVEKEDTKTTTDPKNGTKKERKMITCETDTVKYASDEDAEATCTAAGEALGKALKYMLCSEGRVGFAANGRTNGTRFAAPLDEAYASCLIEQFDSDKNGELKTFSLAPYGPRNRSHIGAYPTVYTETFFREVAKHSGLTIRLEKHRGDNAHHIVEATFKSFARCLRKFMDEIEGNDGSETSGSDNSSSRAASRARSTKETSIDVALDLDKKGGTNGNVEIDTGIETLDGLFNALAETAEFGTFKCVASGDTWIDDHHTTEDVAITVGQCLNEALGNKAGCNRMGSGSASVNGSEVEVIMDLSNRPYLGYDLDFAGDSIGDLSCEMVEHLFMSVTFNGQMTVHVVTKEKGSTDKDLAEAAMRAFGTCLKQCKSIDPRRAGAVASSKGTLSA